MLLDEDGRAVGTADKAGVHHARDAAAPGVLHATSSTTTAGSSSPGAPSRSGPFRACGPTAAAATPRPGEDLADAVRRRVRQELGAEVTDLRLVLPAFRYRAEQDGVVENEMCPVFVGTTRDPVDPDPSEVDSVAWVPWAEFRAGVLDGTRAGLGVVPRAGRPAAGGPARRAGGHGRGPAAGRPARRGEHLTGPFHVPRARDADL